VLLFFALGLLAKPMLVTLPLVLLLLDYWPLGRLKWQQAQPAAPLTSSATPEKQGKKQKKRFREQKKPSAPTDAGKWRVVLPLVYEKIPLFALSAASSVITFYAQQKGGAVAPMAFFSLTARVATAITAYVSYLWKMLWPSGLAIFYPLEVVSPVVVAACLSLLLALTFAAVRWAVKRPYFLVGWLWYLITLLPVIGIIKVGDAAMADRYTYIALLGPFVALVWGSFDFSQALRIPKAALGATAALLIGAVMLVTYFQLGYWRDSFTVFRHALDVNRSNHLAHYSLAVRYMHEKNYEDASSHLKSALEIHPHYDRAYLNLGIVCHHTGKNDEAIENLKKALKANANLPLAHEWLGKIYLAMGQIDIAVRHYHRAIQDDRDNSVSYAGLGEALIFQNRLDEALRYTLQAIEGQPKNEKLHNNAGFILVRQGRFDEAIPRFQEALRLAPDYARAHSNLGGALLQMKRVDEAIRHFETAIRLEPGNQLAQENLKYALSQKKEVKKSGR
jgi:tetratricopeptide (TPR) repeat protein